MAELQNTSVVVPLAPPLNYNVPGGGWLHRITSHGVDVPRPRHAPHVYKGTKASPLMDEIVTNLLAGGILEEGQCTEAFKMIIVPKANHKIRLINDYSAWTEFIDSPKFSLLAAGPVIRSIPRHFHAIKLDLKSGFYQIGLSKRTRHFHGVWYRGVKYRFTRLPIGHALSPYVMQRFSETVLAEVERRFHLIVVSYLDDWLLAGGNPHILIRAYQFLVQQELHFSDKPIVTSVPALPYLGLQVDIPNGTLQASLGAVTKLREWSRHIPNGSRKDLERIAGYLGWLCDNLRWPMFLVTAVLGRDNSFLLEFLENADPATYAGQSSLCHYLHRRNTPLNRRSEPRGIHRQRNLH